MINKNLMRKNEENKIRLQEFNINKYKEDRKALKYKNNLMHK